MATIVGFYFGTSTDADALKVSVRVSVVGDSVRVAAYASGGHPPYTYTFADMGVAGISQDGWITHSWPDTVSAIGRLQVQDADAWTRIVPVQLPWRDGTEGR